MRTINLKEHNNSVEQALFFMQQEIELCKLEGVPIFKIITGYGSHGAGGLIKGACERKLKQLKAHGVIKDYISGDLWNMHYKKAFDYKTKYPTIQDEDFNIPNGGITIIIVF